MKSIKSDILIKKEGIIAKMDSFLNEVRNEPTSRNYFFAYKQIKKLNFSDVEIPKKSKIKIALLSSFTIDLLGIYIDINCRLLGLFPEIYISSFNQYQQEILDENSTLYAFCPELIIFNIQLESLCNQHFLINFPRISDKSKNKEQSTIVTTIWNLLDTLSHRQNSLILLSNFIIPFFSPFGILDSKINLGYIEFYKQLNTKLVKKYKNHKQIHIFDLDKAASSFGKKNITDFTMNYRGNTLFNQKFLPVLSHEYEGYVKALKNLNRKCIVLDLDNTLWGGIVGEVGMEGIKLNFSYPGNEYLDFQRSVLSYHKRGIILAINSKNNYDDAINVIQNHPAMILREKHFASIQINWNDKVENMLKIAAELNIGLDSLIFIDDNPVERERVKQALPDVLTIDIPKDPSLYRFTLENLNDFNTFTLTSEDLERGEMYVARRKREDLKINITSIDDFIESLEITAEIKQANSFTISRITSLVNRTNQFNLTTRRYTEAEMENIFEDKENNLIYSLHIKDKFGDEGIVGVAMIDKGKGIWRIDNILLSCRVIGRKVETVLINKIIKDAKMSGIKQLIGEYIPTNKNSVVKDFYKINNFSLSKNNNGITIWGTDLYNREVEFLKFIKVIEDAE